MAVNSPSDVAPWSALRNAIDDDDDDVLQALLEEEESEDLHLRWSGLRIAITRPEPPLRGVKSTAVTFKDIVKTSRRPGPTFATTFCNEKGAARPSASSLSPLGPLSPSSAQAWCGGNTLQEYLRLYHATPIIAAVARHPRPALEREVSPPVVVAAVGPTEHCVVP